MKGALFLEKTLASFVSSLLVEVSFCSSLSDRIYLSLSITLLDEMLSQFCSSTMAQLLLARGETSMRLGLRRRPRLLDVEVFHSVSNRDMQLEVPVLGLSSKSCCYFRLH
jgi:hypothetical protein